MNTRVAVHFLCCLVRVDSPPVLGDAGGKREGAEYERVERLGVLPPSPSRLARASLDVALVVDLVGLPPVSAGAVGAGPGLDADDADAASRYDTAASSS